MLSRTFVLPVNCCNVHSKFYARYDTDYYGDWVLTYGLKTVLTDVGIEQNGSNSFDIDISNSKLGPQYRCPYCGNKEFVRCGSCKKYTCYSGNGRFICDHCGSTGEVTGTIKKIEGNSFNSQS